VAELSALSPRPSRSASPLLWDVPPETRHS
jgi:hypothetical protein